MSLILCLAFASSARTRIASKRIPVGLASANSAACSAASSLIEPAQAAPATARARKWWRCEKRAARAPCALTPCVRCARGGLCAGVHGTLTWHAYIVCAQA
eukprot:6192994-Pleurochrysis_carterae.AAC.1